MGRAWEAGGAPAYWPWLDVLGGLTRSLDDGQLREALGDEAALLAELVPEIRRRPLVFATGALPPPDEARFRLCRTVVALARRAASPAGLVLVCVQDIQDALSVRVNLPRLGTMSTAAVAPLPLGAPLRRHGDIEARAVTQLETFAAAVDSSKAEGIIPAPESAHAIRVAIDEALRCKQTGEKKVIAFNLSGHGHFDMMAYEAYHRGQLQDFAYPAEKVAEAMKDLPKVPKV